MTLSDVYKTLNGNYDEAKTRMMNDSFLEKMLLKFIKDDSMKKLDEELKKGNIKEAFMAAHTLKGVAANFAFTQLFNQASLRTENLRKGKLPENMDELRKEYDLTINTINKYNSEKRSEVL